VFAILGNASFTVGNIQLSHEYLGDSPNYCPKISGMTKGTVA
jgi:hypothetical protein